MGMRYTPKVSDAEYVVINREDTKPIDGTLKGVYEKTLVQVGFATVSLPRETYIYLGREVTWVTLLVKDQDVLIYPCSRVDTGARKLEVRSDRSRVSFKLRSNEKWCVLKGAYKPSKGLDKVAGIRHVILPGAYIARG